MKASIILGGLLLMGCATVPPEEPAVPEAGTGKTCNAAPAQGLVGRTQSEAVAAEALRLTGAAALRWIAPGTMVTMDYREDRLNLEIDAQKRITKVRCG